MSHIRIMRWGTAVLAATLMFFMAPTAQAGHGGGGHGGGGHGGGGGFHGGGRGFHGGGGGFHGGGGGFARGGYYGGFGGYGGYGVGSYGLGLYGGGYDYTPYTYNYSGNPGYTVYPSSTYYVPDYSLYTQPLMTNTNTSPGMAGTLPVATEYSAHINVKVPDGATVWFDGKKTFQGGTERNFVTPPLDTGKTFSYDLQAAWPQGNRLITQTRKIEITAGGHTDVDFTKPASGEVSTAP